MQTLKDEISQLEDLLTQHSSCDSPENYVYITTYVYLFFFSLFYLFISLA